MFSTAVKKRSVNFLVQTVFSHKYSGFFCVLIAIVSKSLVAWTYSDLEADKSLYLLFAKTFLETGVFAEPVRIVESGHLIYIYNSAILSPMYSFLAVPFIWLTKSYLITQFIIAVLGWILFFTGLVRVARLVFKEEWVVHVFILFSGFFLYPHELASAPKDTLVAAFTLWSIFFINQFLQSKADFRIILGGALSISCLCLTKMLYVPVGFALVALLLIFVFQKKNKRVFVRFAILSALILLIGCIVIVLVILPAQRTIQYISLPGDGTTFIHGFYPGNLLQTFPFISSSVIDTNFWSIQMAKLDHFSYSKIMQTFQVIDVLLFILLLFLLLYNRTKIVYNRVIGMLISVGFVLACFTIYLSLTYQEIYFKSSVNSWTYVSDARSFLMPMIVLQLLVFVFIFQYERASFLRKLIFVLCVFSFIHGVYFALKQTNRFQQADAYNSESSPVKKITSIIRQSSKENEEFSLITSDNILRRYAEIKGIKTYAFIGEPANLSWIKKGNNFLVVTYLQDSLLRNKLPLRDLTRTDTIRPFLCQLYKAR